MKIDNLYIIKFMYYVEFYIIHCIKLQIIYDIFLTRDSLHERLYKKEYIRNI